jgi:hypothetical protein
MFRKGPQPHEAGIEVTLPQPGCHVCVTPRGRAQDMSADVGSSDAEAAQNARLHALCSRPMRLIPAFPLSSGEAETGIKALLSHKVTGALFSF